MTEARIPLLIDTDPGVDDALALLMAFNDMQSESGRHDVVGLTIVAGNVGLRHTVANALKLCEVCGVDVPVHAGAETPLVFAARDAAHVHGCDGFGDTGYTKAARSADSEHAALAILRLSHQYAGTLVLVALGPLTNLALALKLDPTLPRRVARCVVMGASVTAHGNITPAAEFNIAFDPEAAHIVFSGFPRIELADWEAVLAHGFLHADIERWLDADSPRARFYASISNDSRARAKASRGPRWHAADALAMALALQPGGALDLMERPLAVETAGQHARGATIVDWNRQGGAADNVAILMRYDQPRFEAMLEAALAAGA
ncbi:MAG: nucleoside hydrolase [Thermomonas sp.]|uniref:nucleoside hydrolase n=1 Tax=Thermomonas sp. TaxID=1971895 RepID=UPI00261FFFA2|nr:nucleoside hydrolase [Thermomonas sp.]MCC7097737.1 nucleoside hydrolase [Thermomonas sp.]